MPDVDAAHATTAMWAAQLDANYTERGATPRSWLCGLCGDDVDSEELTAHLRGHAYCECGKPVSHLDADEDSTDWGCRVPDFDRATGMIIPPQSVWSPVSHPEAAEEAGRLIHAALLAEARAVVADLTTAESRTPEGVAAVIHRAAGDEVPDELLSALVDVLAA